MNSKYKLRITMNADVLRSLYNSSNSLLAFKKWLNDVMMPAISQEPVTEHLYIPCLDQEATFSLS